MKLNGNPLYIAAALSLICAVVITFTLSTKTTPNGDSTPLEVKFRNPIPPITTGQTPLFLAKEKGFFLDQGLDLILEQGSSELNPIKMVAAGKNDFGMVGGPDALVVARAKGLPLKAIATIHRNANFVCLITLKDKNITSLKQLDNQKVGFFYGHISTDVLRPLFSQNGISVDEVNAGFDYSRLLSGELAAQWAFTVRAALQLPMKGVDINVIRPQDYGVNTHGYTIFAREDFIAKNPEVVEKFLKGLVDGIKYSLNNTEEGVDLLLSLNPALGRDFALKSESVFQSVTSNSQAYPIGYMDDSMFQEAYDRLEKQGLLENAFEISDIYTTEFINKVR